MKAVRRLKTENMISTIQIVLKKSDERSSDFSRDFPEILRNRSTGNVPSAKESIVSPPSKKLPVVRV